MRPEIRSQRLLKHPTIKLPQPGYKYVDVTIQSILMVLSCMRIDALTSESEMIQVHEARELELLNDLL